ncbi:BREX-2 system adenine-specific DNA-methyltransferase PglX [Streptomyces sp. NBC_00268]|uniref:BREX-2 system adenine-specific DNA-methyltransferase PglX n=1 Tax=Streptomyces sp. NBC_00268 TaxID=2975695 RepID=UPI00225B562D|nr:BREX-2 system adenine-specific DNA-methyltransferase PglX [Streptomyces sp. NBC_00268]MCX5184242.1 BREX-2 system adenine-specific DNA-methyltransferase PglX [Streptomyces sp. NBC_00268]
MIDRKSKALLADLIKRVKAVETDLDKQVKAVPEVGARLRAEYDRARELERTAATWNEWLKERVTQVAVAWVLGTVFVRFCEDNGLISEPYLAGPKQERQELAEARYAQYVADDSEGADPTFRGWLEKAFAELGAGQAGKLLFDSRRNPLYQIPLSHDGARTLVEFWRERDTEGRLVHDFTDPLNDDRTEGWDTRFLGDLYQDLSEAARKTYALLQTPEFVEEFILDRTMSPVVRELGSRFGELKMIDPTCGSGHFVLGAFKRMVKLWADRVPGKDAHERVRAALDSVHGVDLNPFAVAIARFRLLMAAMAAANVRTLEEAGRYDWPIHLAVGDSLIKARQLEFGVRGAAGQGELEFSAEQKDELAEFSYATEDVHEPEFKGILEQGRYDVVVGNPPYITVKDKKLNALYRDLYKSCAGPYPLSVPFAERFFQLAKIGQPEGHGYGMVGQITANSFMKREFGTKLIEEYFAHKVELTEVIDTSGAYIPGHGTPTVILAGRRRAGAMRGQTVRTVRTVQGEPATPEQAENGLVWNAIVDQIDRPESTSQWVSVDDLERQRYFGRQPWMLAAGGLEMVERIESAQAARLRDAINDIGTGAVPREHEAYEIGPGALRRHGIPATHQRPIVAGNDIRDYLAWDPTMSVWPYSDSSLAAEAPEPVIRTLWPYRFQLARRVAFGKTQVERGLTWFEYSMFFTERYRVPMSIAAAIVSTHNHFLLDRGGNIFKQSAPVIKLNQDATESEHLSLLGILNSSTVGFWLKMMSHSKGTEGHQSGIKTELWEQFYEFTGAKFQQIPIPGEYPIDLATTLDTLARQLTATSPSRIDTPTALTLRESKTKWLSIRAQMIAFQEELDWQAYSLYNLHSEDLRAPKGEVPELALGERAFEIVLARRVKKNEASSEWFKRHGSTPITELPPHWSDTYKAVVQSRINAIESSRAIGMIERPEYKRRWSNEGWDALQKKALQSWLLDRIEKREHWFDEDGQPTILTRTQLTDTLSHDEDFVSVAELYEPHTELVNVVSGLLTEEHVPFLAAFRYKPAALKKRQDWEHIWELQRREDAAESEAEKRKIRDSIPVPPKYTSADFLKPSYWRARGKLDLPKERFVSYATGPISGTPELFGWAGWDHLEQAQALATYFTVHELATEEITPLLAGLLELQPWLTQWHDEFDGRYGGSPAAFFAGHRSVHQGQHGLTDDDLRAWSPPAATRGRGRRTAPKD